MGNRRRFARREDLGLTRAEFAVLRRLDTPRKIQDFVFRLGQNFEERGETCHTVRGVLRTRKAHCIEGAMLAACAFWVHGEHGSFDAMRVARAQHLAHRAAGLSIDLEVLVQPEQEILDLLR